jgi:hypothetical protein
MADPGFDWDFVVKGFVPTIEKRILFEPEHSPNQDYRSGGTAGDTGRGPFH